MTDKHYSITIIDTKENKVIRTTTVYQDDVKSVGGIGNYIESLDSIISDEEQIRISPFWE